jgi:ArsR family transcriptional regulator, arsenate/arsenite/antimonite-responsive transcriptional repressor
MGLNQYEAVMKAASDSTRVRILKILESGEICVCQIIAVIQLSQPTISNHLSLLKSAGLIKDRKDKKWVFYSLDGKDADGYAERVLRNLRGWLNDDPLIVRDRERTTIARELGPVTICAHGMTLPRRKAVCSAPAPLGGIGGA